jgi:gluconate 2-dehydrogenase gamma chain
MGCVTFTDYQLAGPYGRGDSLYSRAVFEGRALSGRSDSASGTWYRKGLPAFEAAIKGLYGKSFVDLSGDQQDEALRKLEAGAIALGGGLEGKQLFQQLLANARGFSG